MEIEASHDGRGHVLVAVTVKRAGDERRRTAQATAFTRDRGAGVCRGLSHGHALLTSTGPAFCYAGLTHVSRTAAVPVTGMPRTFTKG